MILISAGDYLTAKLVKEAGFDGIWVSGFEASARLGLPDNGSISRAQMLSIVKPMVGVGLPIYVDVDTGYGDFKATVEAFSDLGVAGICIEDNLDPKVNSLWGEKIPIMDKDEFCRKIDLPHKIKIIARTEAFIRGYDDGFERLIAYGKAGADILLPHSRTEPINISGRYGPFAVVPTKFPQFTNEQLTKMGYSYIIWANQTQRTMIKSVRDMLAELKKRDNMMWCEENLCVTLDDMKGLCE